jgi:hypothetical protein
MMISGPLRTVICLAGVWSALDFDVKSLILSAICIAVKAAAAGVAVIASAEMAAVISDLNCIFQVYEDGVSFLIWSVSVENDDVKFRNALLKKDSLRWKAYPVSLYS